MLDLLHSSVPENIIVSRDICNEQLYINGDATQLHQVLMNLVNNARDAVEGVDEPVIAIKLETFTPDNAFIESHTYFKNGSYAHLSVEDDGFGIPENLIEQLFDPFFTTKEQGKGTGLGLSMVFGAIKTHHGYVEVESAENKGSTFHVYIPLLEEVDTVPTSVQEENAVAEGQGQLILLVDDEEDVLATGKEVLETLGYKVLQASDGLEAVEIFTAHQDKISLIITDVVMPRLGGVKAIERIKKIHPDVKVIFATGYDKESTFPDVLPTYGSAILTKPYNIDELSNNIRAQLGS